MNAAPDPLNLPSSDEPIVPGDTTKLHLQRSCDVLQEIDDVCTQFEQALRQGQVPDINVFVSSASEGVRHQVFRELLALEMETQSRRGETPLLEEYQERFPDRARLIKYLYFEHFTPARIGEFPIQRLLGRGSFGHVYQGWDPKLSRNVAIKVFRRDPDDPGPGGGGLLLEARTAAQLRHPGVVTVHAILPDADGDEFLVLEFVDGSSLEDVLRSGRMSPRESASLLLTVAQALQHAHQHGLVHRDLKPANILLEHGRRPRVTDFGLALHLMESRRSPAIAGTLAYMSPEQANGETHRLDARTDLWAAGVVFYRMLTGRLPFAGADNEDLLQAIRYSEPKDVLERDPLIPHELARIVRRCLMKRMNDRYQTAAEFADDLSAFLDPADDQRRNGQTSDILQRDILAVVPKGLRYFDAADREFFLQLVPGPRDRHGIPQGVRFWEQRLGELDPHQTFRVGLLYGPSGCGKSSLVRAGVLPRLLGNVRQVVVEAAAEETEQKLIRELCRHFPGFAPGLTLSEMLGELREGALLQPGEKLLIVIDQFEQWLHGWRHDAVAPLVEALRQCDGGRLQALLLVRDDFWMPATRFFKHLDAPLTEGFNAAAVDLLDCAHANKVLAAFGAAYDRVEAIPSRRPAEQEQFLKLAIGELADDGWVVPVRLCIFAEMLKSRLWRPQTLREVGGEQGLGTVFLAEVFDGRSAAPMHRLHRKAARAVLERLLPPPHSDIRGHLVSESELRVVSGYGEEPTEFSALMRCLDQELRLVTPSDHEWAASVDRGPHPDDQTPRLYQLTHDFLVTAIRGWLNQTRQKTLRGRAELRLSEYASAYSARPEPRQLPSWWEWLNILVFTSPWRWKTPQRSMMRAATRRYALRIGLAIAGVTALAAAAYDRIAATRADELVQALATSDSRDVPAIVERLPSYARWARPRVAEQLAAEQRASDKRTRFLLGSLAIGNPQLDELRARLLDSEPPLAVAIADLMHRYGVLQPLEPQLRAIAADSQGPHDQRVRAFVALAHLDSVANTEQWQSLASDAATLLLRDLAQQPRYFDAWVNGLSPARQWLIKPLCTLFSDPNLSEQEQVQIAEILARYAASDESTLLELALEARPPQFAVISKSLPAHTEAARSMLLREVDVAVSDTNSEDEKDRLERRRANAILLLNQFGTDKYLWPALQHRPDPRLRSFLIDHLQKVPTSPADWIPRISQEHDPGARQALVVVLGGAARESLSVAQRAQLADALLRVYRDDIDPGVHGAAAWTLRRLAFDAQLERATEDLSRIGMRPGYQWYVTTSKITMVIFQAPGPVQVGSPKSEPGRDDSDEQLRTVDVDWSFALSSTEITQAQYQGLMPGYRDHLNANAPEPSCPVNAVPWLGAVEFCRRLSEQDGVSESEMTIPTVDNLKKTPYPDFRTHSGYRLPLEVEWEVACRAGTVTPRFFGYAPDLLPMYSWYISNSYFRSWTVAQTLPNPAGLFDMLGNVSEWCFDVETSDPRGIKAPGFAMSRYFVRGSDYACNAHTVRSGNRRDARWDEFLYSRGFRIAHTIHSKPPDSLNHDHP